MHAGFVGPGFTFQLDLTKYQDHRSYCKPQYFDKIIKMELSNSCLFVNIGLKDIVSSFQQGK